MIQVYRGQIVTARLAKRAKVMFSVCVSVHRGGGAGAGAGAGGGPKVQYFRGGGSGPGPGPPPPEFFLLFFGGNFYFF